MPRLLLLALAAILPLAGCGGGPTTVHVAATAAPDINPDAGGSAFPAQVRLYLLRSPSKFNNADYFQLSDHEAAALGNDLVSRTEVMLHPRESQVINLPTQPDSKFVGVAVAFRNIDTATWRAVTPLRENLKLSLAGDRLTLGPK